MSSQCSRTHCRGEGEAGNGGAHQSTHVWNRMPWGNAVWPGRAPALALARGLCDVVAAAPGGTTAVLAVVGDVLDLAGAQTPAGKVGRATADQEITAERASRHDETDQRRWLGFDLCWCGEGPQRFLAPAMTHYKAVVPDS
jgi:hypothetical protein